MAPLVQLVAQGFRCVAVGTGGFNNEWQDHVLPIVDVGVLLALDGLQCCRSSSGAACSDMTTTGGQQWVDHHDIHQKVFTGLEVEDADVAWAAAVTEVPVVLLDDVHPSIFRR